MAGHGKRLIAFASALLVLTAGAPAGATVGAADRTLRLIHLESGGLAGSTVDINARGQILGYLQGGGPTRPTLWLADGTRVEIGIDDYPYDLNDRGDVLVGASLWSNGRVVPVSHPSGRVHASKVNNRGQVFGTLSQDPGPSSTAFRWENGQFTEINGPGGEETSALAANERGDVLGRVSDPLTGPAADTFVWRDGVMSLLGLSGEQADVRDLNDRGQVLGNRYLESRTHPFLWHRGRTTDLLAGRPGQSGRALRLNNAGDAVGQLGARPVLWRNGRTILIGPAGWTGAAVAVNERGDVAGAFTFEVGEFQYDSRIFLWRGGRLLLSEPVLAPMQPIIVGMDESGRVAGSLRHSTEGGSQPVVWTMR